jgi:hypothetical protein
MMCYSAKKAGTRFGHAVSVFMAVVVFVASLAVAAHGALAEGAPSPVPGFVNHQHNVPKPCQKASLPGAVNTCPLSGFSLNSIPCDAASATDTPTVHDVRWKLLMASLVAPCGDHSPYRPPCPTA